MPWGLFLCASLIAIFVAASIPFVPVVLFGGLVAIFFAYQYIYTSFGLAVALTPFLGLNISIPTGELLFGKRAFGGAIDISLAEFVCFVVLAAWAFKLFFLWSKRGDQQWHPRLPLAESYFAMTLAHLSSGLSRLLPDPVLVAKYAMRPILFDYLAFIALPVNLIKSRSRLMNILAILVCVGVFAAANGLVAMFFPPGGGFIGRARPMPIFGYSALGENHNSLGDLMVVTVPFALALAELVREERHRRILHLAAAFMFLIGLLTFSRSTWLVFILQIVFLFFTEWREIMKKHLSQIFTVSVFAIPLVFGMSYFAFASQTAKSSNSTRLVLAEIAQDLFLSSPWLGAGAGSFVDRVGSTNLFVTEFGAPLDSHGFIQKVAAEAGLIGLAALAAVVLHFFWLVHQGKKKILRGPANRAFVLLVAGACGVLFYQVFDTDYWTGKMWLPIGITLASIPILTKRTTNSDRDATETTRMLN
ncbi:O-antigen ligase family protein [Candidatus Uhrbacteria bacterium]|nr:O-antigen ligase family protein [Candidatus Uhrbacteria bacterium]